MKIFNEKKPNLPLLLIDQSKERELVDSSVSMISLVASKLLVYKKLNLLLTDFLLVSKKIYSLLNLNKHEDIEEKLSLSNNYPIYKILIWNKNREIKKSKPSKKKLEELDKNINKEKARLNALLNKEIIKLSNSLQKKLNEFEISNNVKLEILKNINLYLCKKCKKIISEDKFHSVVCDCGKEIKNPTDCNMSIVFKFDNQMISFVEQNMWLEYGIDYLLRKVDLKTLCGFYILGKSGMKHEIDNFGEDNKKYLRIVCECKNTDVTINTVFIFIGKMIDIGCSRGFIFTTSYGTSLDVIRVAKNNNIEVIEQVLEKDDKDILKFIQSK